MVLVVAHHRRAILSATQLAHWCCASLEERTDQTGEPLHQPPLPEDATSGRDRLSGKGRFLRLTMPFAIPVKAPLVDAVFQN